ncbi:MAG TPA: trypsin-like peptidase domain-containing protein [Nannocystis sp.]
MTPAELFSAYAPAVVTIRTQSLLGSSAGTGFIVDGSGLIATNHHVIDGGNKLTVKRFDGSETDKVEIVDQDPERDLALLKIEAEDTLPVVTLGDSDGVTVGEAVIVIGNPLGLEHTLTDGLVSSRRLLRDKRFIQMSAPVSPGNSGGPVFNRRGEVIGVTVAKLAMGFGENLNLAIPVNDLKTLIARDHAQGKRGGSTW